MCVVTYEMFLILDNPISVALKCLLLANGVCNWDSLNLDDIFDPTNKDVVLVKWLYLLISYSLFQVSCHYDAKMFGCRNEFTQS
jgi:hypothetical protein